MISQRFEPTQTKPIQELRKTLENFTQLLQNFPAFSKSYLRFPKTFQRYFENFHQKNPQKLLKNSRKNQEKLRKLLKNRKNLRKFLRIRETLEKNSENPEKFSNRSAVVWFSLNFCFELQINSHYPGKSFASTNRSLSRRELQTLL